MSFYLDAVEPHARPKRRTVTVHEGQSVCLWAVQMDRDAGPGLRRTVFRTPEQVPPQDAVLVCWLSADDHGLTATRVGTMLHVELVRSDHRSRLVGGMRIPNQASFELTLGDGSRVDLTLSIRRQSGAGAELTIGGGGTRRSRVVYSANNVWWVITDGKGLAVTFTIKIWDGVRDRLMKLGIDSRVLSFMSGLLLSAALGFYISYTQYQRAQSEEERAETAETALSRAEAAQAASLATELACLNQRKELVSQLGAIDAKQQLAAEIALGLALANKVSVEFGGDLLGDPRLLAADGLLAPGLTKAVVRELKPAATDIEACEAQSAALSNDLPPYLLLYHPDPAVACPSDYASVDAGVDRAGRFGLSERVAREFRRSGDDSTGAPPGTLEDLLGDPRFEDRWAAFTLATAYRETTRLLLEGARTERPPVLPSQSQLWALALFDAYNHLSSTPDGVLDAPMEVCVSRVLTHRVDTAPPAAPGDPVLPDIVAVAFGDEAFAAPPTPGCPWPRDAIQQGAISAIHTVSRLAAQRLEED